jgi:Leu/Phe-tRNA-protein transferase
VETEHLARFGATNWSRDAFRSALRQTLAEKETRRGPWTFDDPA